MTNEAHIDKIAGYSADETGLRIVARTREDGEENVGVIVIPHGQLEAMLDAIALGMRYRKMIGQS